MNAGAAVEQILSEGNTQSTLKFAVMLAIVHTIKEAPAQEPRNGFHLLPVVDLARRVLAYYWKPAVLGVKQAQSGFTAFNIINRLQQDCPATGNHSLVNADAGRFLHDWLPQANQLPLDIRRGLLGLRKNLIEMPLKHLPNVGGRRVEVFSFVTTEPVGTTTNWLVSSYDEHLQRAPGKSEFSKCNSWLDLLSSERSFVVISGRTWEELAELRFWLEDAILLRWLRECERYANGQPVLASCLQLPEPNRDSEAMANLRLVHAKIGWATCIYTGERLKGDLHMDHVLPFSRFPVNFFWNIAPTRPATNLNKRDFLPPLDGTVAARYREMVAAVLTHGRTEVGSDLFATWRQYFQSDGTGALSEHAIVNSIWALMSRSYASLVDCGVRVWAPGSLTNA